MSISKFESDFILNVLETISSPVFVKDRQHRWMLMNKAMCEFIGKSADELLGKNDYDFFSKEEADVFRQKDEEVFTSGKPVENEENFTDQSGKMHRILTKKSCFGTGDDAVLVGIIHDITAQKELADSLAKAKEAAEEMSRLKTSFVANISHEIRTPMNGVLGMAELLQETNLTEEQREFVDCLLASGKTLLSVVNDVLDFSKVESGKMEISNEPFALPEVLGALEHTFRSQFVRRKVDFFCEIDPSIPKDLLGDAGRLLQILTNLVGNSLKFTLPDGMVWVALRSEVMNQQKVLNLYVFDSGIGIPKEKQKMIFDPFMQADSGISRTFGGTGLGLSIVSKLVRLMNGQIELRSRPRVGTMIRVTIPLNTAEIVDDGQSDVLERDRDPNAAVRILIAEDNKVNQLLIAKILQNAGYQTTFAENGEEALRLNTQTKFDLILMDIQMPILDGESATQLIRSSKVNNNVPIIALTANAFRTDAEQYRAIGMDGHVAKPITKAELFSEINRVVHKER